MTRSFPASRAPRSDSGAVAQRRLERAGLAFEAGVLEELHARRPEDLALLVALAEACTRLRRYRRGLELDRRLVEHDPRNPTFRYNLACSCSLTGDLEAARAELLVALDLGFRDLELLLHDPDLRRLRRDPCFDAVRTRLAQLPRPAAG